MLKDQVQVVAPDEYRRRIHWLIDRVLDAADEHNERLRWLILACREMGELEFLDRGIVHNVLRNPLSGDVPLIVELIERALPEWRVRGLGTLLNRDFLDERADTSCNSGGRSWHLCLDGQRDAVGRHLVGGRWYAV